MVIMVTGKRQTHTPAKALQLNGLHVPIYESPQLKTFGNIFFGLNNFKFNTEQPSVLILTFRMALGGMITMVLNSCQSYITLNSPEYTLVWIFN